MRVAIVSVPAHCSRTKRYVTVRKQNTKTRRERCPPAPPVVCVCVKFVPGPGPVSPPRDTYYGTFTDARACGSCVRVGVVLDQGTDAPQ